MNNKKLAQRANFEVAIHGSDRAVARVWNVSHGIVTRARNGGNSPTLRGLWNVSEYPKRTRLHVDCDRNLIDLYDKLKEGKSRGKFLEDLLQSWMEHNEQNIT